MRGCLVLRLLSVGMVFILASTLASAGQRVSESAGERVGESAGQRVSESDKDFLASLDSEQAGVEDVKEPPVYLTALGFTVKLVLVLGLCYVTILGLKRFSNLRGPIGAGQRHIRMIDNLSLGANRGLHLVAVGSRRLLVASTSSQINVLTELGADEVPEEEAPAPVAGFKDQLAAFLGARTDASATEKKIVEVLRDSSAFIQNKAAQIRKRRVGVKAEADE